MAGNHGAWTEPAAQPRALAPPPSGAGAGSGSPRLLETSPAHHPQRVGAACGQSRVGLPGAPARSSSTSCFLAPRMEDSPPPSLGHAQWGGKISFFTAIGREKRANRQRSSEGPSRPVSAGRELPWTGLAGAPHPEQVPLGAGGGDVPAPLLSLLLSPTMTVTVSTVVSSPSTGCPGGSQPGGGAAGGHGSGGPGGAGERGTRQSPRSSPAPTTR